MDVGFEPEHYKFGGGAAATVLHPIALIAMIIAILVIFWMNRRYSVIALLLFTFLIPAGQQLVLGGAHVFLFRLVVLAGLIRMMRSRSSSGPSVFAGGWNSIDTAFFISIVGHAVAFMVFYREMGAVNNQIGFLWDYLGAYTFLRYAIAEEADVNNAIKCFAALALILAACMVREQLTGENIFGELGGVRLISELRDGEIRSEGVFQHSILAGTFAATIVPLFVWLWKSGEAKFAAVIGTVSSLIMIATCRSSTPLLALGAGMAAVSAWPLRNQLRLLRWGAASILGGLAVVMNAPVWFLIAHVGVVGGSSADHRAHLVDTFLRHIGDWWLLGTDSNGNWGYFMFDTSNEYVQFGVTGGLIAMGFLIVTIIRAFGHAGSARKAVAESSRTAEWRAWCLGAAVFANTAAFFGISYFDQTKVSWFALLAMVSAVSALSLTARTAAAWEPALEQSLGDAGSATFPALMPETGRERGFRPKAETSGNMAVPALGSLTSRTRKLASTNLGAKENRTVVEDRSDASFA